VASSALKGPIMRAFTLSAKNEYFRLGRRGD